MVKKEKQAMTDLKVNGKNKIDKQFQERSLQRKNKLSKQLGKRLSFQQIALDSNLPCGIVKRVLKGDRGAKLTEAYGIAEALGTTIDFLSDKAKECAISQNHTDLVDYLHADRIEVVSEIERLSKKLADIDLRLELSVEVLKLHQ